MNKTQKILIYIVSLVLFLALSGPAFAQDADGDGYEDSVDNCPNTWQPSQLDEDGDGIGNWCDICPLDANNDSDNDGVCGDIDNCPVTWNTLQSDTDNDGVGNNCDNCADVANPNQADADNNTIGDVCDSDTIYGTISGDVLEDVTVNLYILDCGASQPHATLITDAQGYYSIGDFVVGRYLIFVEKTGYSFAPAWYWADLPNEPGQSYDSTATSD